MRRSYEAFARRDRATVESILSDDFTFTSPYDDHIDRSAFFERCWPFGDTIDRFEILDVWSPETESLSFTRSNRNTVMCFGIQSGLKVQAGQIKEVEVFFGALAAPRVHGEHGECRRPGRHSRTHRAAGGCPAIQEHR